MRFNSALLDIGVLRILVDSSRLIIVMNNGGDNSYSLTVATRRPGDFIIIFKFN